MSPDKTQVHPDIHTENEGIHVENGFHNKADGNFGAKGGDIEMKEHAIYDRRDSSDQLVDKTVEIIPEQINK